MRTERTEQVRGTQSFVYTMQSCWKRPSLTALEVAWRWLFGAPAAALIWFAAARVVGQSGVDLRVLQRISLADPEGAAAILAQVWDALRPGAAQAAEWLVPLLLVIWVLVSAVGRTVVLRRADPGLRGRPGTLVVLQSIRVVALGGSFAVWFALVQWAGRVAIAAPVAAGGEPNSVLYAALVIVASLGLFTLWAVASWALSVAPLVAMLRGTGPVASLAGAFRLGPMRGKLVEINLVMGIVKIALIVLAMVASASPLPFESVESAAFLTWWYVGVTVVYLVASDFFHVVRLVAYLELWRVYEE
ncbi:MAG TPA: hypothetical protein VHU44_14480 [Acidobacteriaceae bacterium]|nr:hypothetical protein [Acidobacteriaceae bacterium]